MITINAGCLNPAPCSLDPISSIAFDGCGFALPSAQGCGITKLDGSFCPIETLCTTRKYTFLCFDQRERCYWASAEDSPVLYQLDRWFCEIGCIKLLCQHNCHLCGISCDPCYGTLLLLYPDFIEYVDPCTGECQRFPNCTQAEMNLGIQALCGGYLLAYLKHDMQYIAAHCPGCGPQAEFCIPRGYSFEAMFLREQCHERNPGCTRYEVGLLLRRQCDQELVQLWMWVTCCGEHTPPCPPVPPCPPTPPCPPIPPYPPYPPHTPCLPCCCGKYEIMHSVALEEAGLAHILNAEGEKLQKVVAESTSVEELLKVNESVRRTITQITLLEGQLYSKLDVLTDICEEDDPCDNPHCPCGCDCEPY